LRNKISKIGELEKKVEHQEKVEKRDLNISELEEK
jgi:hypothetical protein